MGEQRSLRSAEQRKASRSSARQNILHRLALYNTHTHRGAGSLGGLRLHPRRAPPRPGACCSSHLMGSRLTPGAGGRGAGGGYESGRGGAAVADNVVDKRIKNRCRDTKTRRKESKTRRGRGVPRPGYGAGWAGLAPRIKIYLISEQLVGGKGRGESCPWTCGCHFEQCSE